MPLPLTLFITFVALHLFFVSIKVIFSVFNLLERRLFKSILTTILILLFFYFIFIPGSIWIAKSTSVLVGKFKWNIPESVPNFKEKIAILFMATNILLFTLFHQIAKKSRNKFFKIIYDINYPANN